MAVRYAEATGNKQALEVIQRFQTVLSVSERQLYETYEMRGRLSERYKHVEFPLPWEVEPEDSLRDWHARNRSG